MRARAGRGTGREGGATPHGCRGLKGGGARFTRARGGRSTGSCSGGCDPSGATRRRRCGGGRGKAHGQQGSAAVRKRCSASASKAFSLSSLEAMRGGRWGGRDGWGRLGWDGEGISLNCYGVLL